MVYKMLLKKSTILYLGFPNHAIFLDQAVNHSFYSNAFVIYIKTVIHSYQKTSIIYCIVTYFTIVSMYTVLQLNFNDAMI